MQSGLKSRLQEYAGGQNELTGQKRLDHGGLGPRSVKRDAAKTGQNQSTNSFEWSYRAPFPDTAHARPPMHHRIYHMSHSFTSILQYTAVDLGHRKLAVGYTLTLRARVLSTTNFL